MGEIVARALAEDLGPGDVTADSVVPADATATARLIQKAPGVLSGLDAAAEAFRQVGAGELEPRAGEGEWREDVPIEIAVIRGPARALLAGERTALNLLCHLSGVATLTARYVSAVDGTRARVIDTRKTTPGLRALEKRAVLDGGGLNHRLGLFDAILIKENHAALGGGTAAAVRAAREARPDLPVEIECRDIEEVRAALGEGADRLLLDNMPPAEMAAAVALRDLAVDEGRDVALEASGGISLESIRAVAESGVDLISVGALTHSAPVLDISLLLDADSTA
ncbi:carboxylating nicotinate-nucleotide diphosphorylase [Thermoleophilia bacterium SCSIO 60948]|nr:carboxylating nicotinate-nucleotide diphosphorylase [Thermoleophilia bacterium SCSIO 60948]